MKYALTLLSLLLAGGCLLGASDSAKGSSLKSLVLDYVEEPTPPGIRVVRTELEGPVFATAQGLTLYRWPQGQVRNGVAGEAVGATACFDVQIKETAGLASIYPAGEILPDADNRPTCVQHWPIVKAAANAQPIGNWTLIDRPDGIKQWAYKGQGVYTSHLDAQPGETNGARSGKNRDSNAVSPREVVAPTPDVPAQFRVASMELGRLLTTATGLSVYAYAKDTATTSNCSGGCLDDWKPVLAPEFAVDQGEWSIIQRRNSDRQWAFRGKPLYTHVNDSDATSYEGSDVPGWSNVFIHRTPDPPKGFGIVDTHGGQVRTDPTGKTIYVYHCGEDSADFLYCDTPGDPQAYRWAVCGGGSPERCVKTFPYVLADKRAKSNSLAWSIRSIDPQTGRYVEEGTPGSLRIWAFRGRPVYTFAGDHQPGDIEADSWGPDHGQSNGYAAFWVRDDFDVLDGYGLLR